MRRFLFNLLAFASLLLWVTTIAFWVRSIHRGGGIRFTDAHLRTFRIVSFPAEVDFTLRFSGDGDESAPDPGVYHQSWDTQILDGAMSEDWGNKFGDNGHMGFNFSHWRVQGRAATGQHAFEYIVAVPCWALVCMTLVLPVWRIFKSRNRIRKPGRGQLIKQKRIKIYRQIR